MNDNNFHKIITPISRYKIPNSTEASKVPPRKLEKMHTKSISEESIPNPKGLPETNEFSLRKPKALPRKPQIIPRRPKITTQTPDVRSRKSDIIQSSSAPTISVTTQKSWPPPLPSRSILGGFTNSERLSMGREQHESTPMIINSPMLSRNLEDSLIQIKSNSLDKNIHGRDFAFHEVSFSNMAATKNLATEGDAINEKTGDTALHLAVVKEDLSAVLSLIRRGVDIDSRNKFDITPIQIAVERENLPIIKALYEAGADINQRNQKKESLLHIAAASCGLETIDLLIDLGIDLNSADNRKQTPIFRATKKGYIVVIEKFEEFGADLFVKDTFERSLLHYAAWNGQTEAVDWLLNYGLDINEKTIHGWTPLHWAVANRQIQTAHLLLRRGADINVQDSSSRTPLYWATEAGNLALIDLLSSYQGKC